MVMEGARNSDMSWLGFEPISKWAHAIENSERGVWHLTPSGQAMSDDELRTVWKRIVAEQRERRKNKLKASPTGEEEEQAIEEVPWKERLLDVLLAMDPKPLSVSARGCSASLDL